jgi:osmotically-inducible protein OsmY
MKKYLIYCLMFVVSLQFGCADREDRTEAAGEAAMTDSELEQRVETQIRTDPSLSGTNMSVDADAEQNMVTLSGKVESEEQRNSAVQLARNAHPGIVVNNQITVEPREISRSEYTEEHAREARQKAEQRGDRIGSSLDDAWIHMKITTKLIGDRDTSARQINIDVNNNRVALRGTVDTAEEKAEAERIAKETEGVSSVNNQLKVATTRTQ